MLCIRTVFRTYLQLPSGQKKKKRPCGTLFCRLHVANSFSRILHATAATVMVMMRTTHTKKYYLARAFRCTQYLSSRHLDTIAQCHQCAHL